MELTDMLREFARKLSATSRLSYAQLRNTRPRIQIDVAKIIFALHSAAEKANFQYFQSSGANAGYIKDGVHENDS